jgi:hypothetical protein
MKSLLLQGFYSKSKESVIKIVKLRVSEEDFNRKLLHHRGGHEKAILFYFSTNLNYLF